MPAVTLVGGRRVPRSDHPDLYAGYVQAGIALPDHHKTTVRYMPGIIDVGIIAGKIYLVGGFVPVPATGIYDLVLDQHIESLVFPELQPF